MMSIKKIFLPALLTIGLYGCNNLEDAELTDRKTFIHFYESANSFVASSVDLTDDGGYIITGYIPIEGDRDDDKILVIKTDKFGRPTWQEIINGGSGSSLVPRKNAAGETVSYLVVGDSVLHLRNDIRYGARLIEFDLNGNTLTDRTHRYRIDGKVTDYHATGVTTDEEGKVITLGTRVQGDGDEVAVVTALTTDLIDTLWQYQYDYPGLDYVNINSVYCKNGKVIWGASVQDTDADLAKSYIALPVVDTNSVFTNSDLLGKNAPQISFFIHDLQPATGGYVAIGTYSELDGTKSNIFFTRISSNGSFKEESLRLFDGILSRDNESLSEATSASSEIEDEGLAVVATRDGGFLLAGSLETNVSRGKGGKDIWLIKLDAEGNALWNKLIGGESSEIVSAVRETGDGGIVLCGTIQDGLSQTGGLSGIFLIKTDSKGEIND